MEQISFVKPVIIHAKIVQLYLLIIVVVAILINKGFQMELVAVYVLKDFMMTHLMNNAYLVIILVKFVLPNLLTIVVAAML